MHYNRIVFPESIDVNISNNSKECMIIHYWIFNHGFKLQDYVCNGCHDWKMQCLRSSDITIITVKNVDNRCVIHKINNFVAIHFLRNSVLDDRGCI